MTRVSRRYAKALFALAQDGGTVDTVAGELAQLSAALSDPAILAVLASPTLGAARLTTLAQRLGEQFQLSQLTRHFLGVLAHNRRMDELVGVAAHFQRMQDRALGRIRITIRAATALSAARQAEIVARFEKLSGKTVLATVEVVPALLGGVTVDVEGKVYDGSVRTQLDRLAHEMTGGRTYL